MRKGQMSKEQAIAMCGAALVEAVERENADFTNRVMDAADDAVEFSASVDAGDGATLTAYYYQNQADIDAAGDDLSNLDWEVAGYEVN